MLNTAILLEILEEDSSEVVLTEKGREIQYLNRLMKERKVDIELSDIIDMDSVEIREKRKEIVAPNTDSIRSLIKKNQVTRENVMSCSSSKERKYNIIYMLNDTRPIVEIVIDELNSWRGRESYDRLLYCTSRLNSSDMVEVAKAIVHSRVELPPLLLNRISNELSVEQLKFILLSMYKDYLSSQIPRSTLSGLVQSLSTEVILSFDWDEKENYFKTELIHLKGVTREEAFRYY